MDESREVECTAADGTRTVVICEPGKKPRLKDGQEPTDLMDGRFQLDSTGEILARSDQPARCAARTPDRSGAAQAQPVAVIWP